jgi:mRNA interferase MazF
MVFDPKVGHEQAGRRPALVLSQRTFTEITGLAVVCPITSRIRGMAYEVLLEDTQTQGAVMPIQVKSLDIAARKIVYIEKAPERIVASVQQLVISIVEG